MLLELISYRIVYLLVKMILQQQNSPYYKTLRHLELVTKDCVFNYEK